MAAVDCSSSFKKSPVSCQPCKPTSYCLQVFRGLREVDDLVANGHHLLSNSVDDAVDSGTRHPKHSGTTLYDAPLANQKRNTKASIVTPHPCLRSWWRRSSSTARDSLLSLKSGLVSSWLKNLSSTGTARLILQYRGLGWIG